MGIPSGLLGPIIGGLLGFLGAVGAAVITFLLVQRERVHWMDEERAGDDRRHELGHIQNIDSFPHRGTSGAMDDMH